MELPPKVGLQTL